MPMNPLPPQAYTKETLQKAYEWLLAQSSSVKELARDKDIMVSMYLTAQRNGEAALETPTVQNFKQELKSLTSLMKDFDPSAEAHKSMSLPNVSKSSLSQSSGQTLQALQSQALQSQSIQSQVMQSQVVQSQMTTSQTVVSYDVSSLLDDKTLSAVREIQEKLNIGSEVEALRVLVTLGLKQFKKLDL